MRVAVFGASLAMIGVSATLHAQDTTVTTTPVVSMGLPPRVHPYVGGFAAWGGPGAAERNHVSAAVGAYRDIGNAIFGLRALGLEAYASGAYRLDGGVRLLGVSPALFAQLGADLSARSGNIDLVLSLIPPIRRGGILGRATQLRLDWFPTRENTFAAGLVLPVEQPWLGRRRNLAVAAALPRSHGPRAPAPRDSAVIDALRGAADAAHWITTYSIYPRLDGGGLFEHKNLPAFRAALIAWRDSIRRYDSAYPSGRSYPAVVAQYHRVVERAFTAAADGDRSTARHVTAAARAALLEDVLLPYDRLLGQHKRHDDLRGLGERARLRLASWLDDSTELAPSAKERSLAVLDALVGIADESRRVARRAWGGSTRSVWVPLQLALRPEDHDTQAELDRLIERAVGDTFTSGNEFAAASGSWFSRGLVQSIAEARDYHVLWIHDFRGTNAAGGPDSIGFAVAVRGYLAALTARVREYDRTGKLPAYVIMLDQFFYEDNDGRRWVALLQDPLAHRVALDKNPAMRVELDRAQGALRDAVAQSTRLQREAKAHGGAAWLRRVVKVHVSVTTQPDWSLRSGYGVWGFPILPDHRMRDHRKIVIYDVSEHDPNRGRVLFGGTGVGEQYESTLWEDRVIAVRGPVARSAKAAAVRALEEQGFRDGDIPAALRPQPAGAGYDRLVADRVRAGAVIPMLSVHNEVGFASKHATVARAMLYTLMPPGSIIYVPDAYWSSATWAGQLIGAALRGSHVFVIAPTRWSAPVGRLELARQRELMARLMEVQRLMEADLTDAGGGFRVGFYTRKSPVGDLPARLRESALGYRTNPFLRNAVPFADSLSRLFEAVADSMQRTGYVTRDRADGSDSSQRPLLHRKTQFFATRAALAIVAREPVARQLLPHMIQTVTDATTDTASMTAAADEDMQGLRALIGLHRRLPPAIRDRATYYVTIGSMNMDPVSARSNGEVLTVVSGPASMIGFLDFFQLAGVSTWPTTQVELDAMIPRSGRLTRWLAHRFRHLI